MTHLDTRLAAQQLALELDAAGKKFIAKEGYDPQFGARPLKRVIQQRLENALAGRILAGELGDGDSVRVDYQGKSFTFTKVAPTPVATVG